MPFVQNAVNHVKYLSSLQKADLCTAGTVIGQRREEDSKYNIILDL